MDSATIRERFLSFFGERDHMRIPSSSLVPDDPTLLLTNAGMIQFKPYFSGEQRPPSRRAITVQKCFRTPDIDEVGKTTRHLTFFEMLGNFSFGDYYKADACPWGWELVTERWGVDPDRLWVTIFETDDEARAIWIDGVGVRPERIVPRSREHNFWDMGVAGPCGPSSEIFVDLGDAFGEPSKYGPGEDEARYVEIYNLVFMQNNCNAAIEPVAELPQKNIDTGAGLERTAFVLQNASSIYDTDLLLGMVHTAEDLTQRTYGRDARTDMSLRVLADHGRGTAFLIADGVLPSNKERGYVLRRVMRRAVRHARLLGRAEPVLPALVDSAITLMGDAYPELEGSRDLIVEVAAREEERFGAALKQGVTLLETGIADTQSSGAPSLPGEVAFRLHDTFGFPVELTTELAGEAGVPVDVAGFESLMAGQRARARAARTTEHAEPRRDLFEPLLEEHGATDFLGYEHLITHARIIGIFDGAEGVPAASEGDEVDIVLDRTAFYAEGGGQVGDRGVIQNTSGAAAVTDTRRFVPGLTAHDVTMRSGELKVGDEVEAIADPVWRLGSQRAHTATHILHWILQNRLGEHARQAGSLVEPGRLRFDFSHFDALGDAQVADVSAELQERVSIDDPVRAFETSLDFAKSIGAMAIFGEKYGDFVRVVEVGAYSKELCGGTHVPHTSSVGVVVVTGESSVGANLRRIEALVGHEGLHYLERRAATLERAAGLLKTSPDEVAERVERLLTTQKDMERRLAEVERAAAAAEAATLAHSAVELDGSRLVVARRDEGVDALRSLAQMLKGRLGSSVIVFGTASSGKANLVGAVSKDLTALGLSARDLLAPGAALLGGGAGGKPELAVSGGPSSDRLSDAMEAVERAARDALLAK
ncbi:MAG: alanine--tRNA ligase [Actinobacteria bacterium]|nr:alanine--tRNA ligase [Actinomycetota bacterium]